MQFINQNGYKIALIDSSYKVENAQDALDLMASAQYHGGSGALIVHKECFNEDFFDLKTRLAGELLQKFSTYRVQLAIIGDFSHYQSKALHDFIYECNQGRQILWANTVDHALNVLAPVAG
ncbi:DUF4180 domain-containing protein [Eubacteriaceae bacterium ES2]|nr:DUF4180 domain-containing protein [Eubacteriaceae bacterium ES2]